MLENNEEIAFQLYELGNQYLNQGKFEAAISSYSEALKFHEHTELKKAITFTLYKLGNKYFDQDKFKDAISSYSEALKFNHENIELKTDLYGKCGLSYFNLFYDEIKELNNAKDYIQKAKDY